MSIKRIVGKETTQYTLEQYGNALAESTPARKQSEVGELVIDVGGDPLNPLVYITNIDGNLLPVGSGGNGAVSRIIAGNNVSISPSTGIGAVTINAIATGVQAIPAVYFTAPTTGNNQTFSNVELAKYTSNTDITLFLNGALLENDLYTLAGDTITITTSIYAGDSIDIPVQYLVSNGGGGTPGGTDTQLQFNNAGVFGGITTATWDGNILSLGSNANINITGGTDGQFLRTDGTGNLSWGTGGGGGNLIIIGRTSNIDIPVVGGAITIVGRTGNIVVDLS